MTQRPTGTAFSRVAEVFGAFLVLGLTSFGGPVAHLGYFREAFVVRRSWLDETAYADLVGLCQFLPGPASSQVGIAIGHMRAGLPGAFAAWLAFTAPSVLLIWAFALGADLWHGPLAQGVLHGLKIAALAVVAQAVWQLAARLTPDWPRRIGALTAATLVLFVPLAAMPVLVIAGAGLIGAFVLPRPVAASPSPTATPGGASTAALVAFVVLLIVLPIASRWSGNAVLDIADRFYRTGALVFGGGHVVLPLLQHELVDPGLIGRDAFLAGYGAAQAVPGPLFSFAFYAGDQLVAAPNGPAGGLLALAAIYLPSFLLVLGTLSWWEQLKKLPRLRAALDGANAAVVGLLLAALVNPVFPAAIDAPPDLAIAIAALFALLLRAPPLIVVAACAVAGLTLAATGTAAG